MILIGERINGMFKDVKNAIAEKDKKVIQDLAQSQTEAGAKYLDVNVGTAAADQKGAMQWLVETIQETCSTSLSLDSQKPDVIAAGLKVINADNGVILNSTPLNKKSDSEVMDKYIEMAQQAGPKVNIIALTMDSNGVPQNVDTRVAIAKTRRRMLTHAWPSPQKSSKKPWEKTLVLIGSSSTQLFSPSGSPTPRRSPAISCMLWTKSHISPTLPRT